MVPAYLQVIVRTVRFDHCFREFQLADGNNHPETDYSLSNRAGIVRHYRTPVGRHFRNSLHPLGQPYIAGKKSNAPPRLCAISAKSTPDVRALWT